jgi:hypothetical protein
MGPALLATSLQFNPFRSRIQHCDPEFANLFSAGGFRLGAARGCASCRVVEAIMPATGFRPAGGKTAEVMLFGCTVISPDLGLPALQVLEKNGGDEGTRTCGLCRDRATTTSGN